MIHVETSAPDGDRWHPHSTHRTLRAAAESAARTAAARVRVRPDPATLEALLASGEAYETAYGEVIAPTVGLALVRP